MDAAAPERAVEPPSGCFPILPSVGRKCEQLLDGARAVILARGFEGASVDDIAREAGISKATMYRYYPDKSALFAAVMQRDCGRQTATLDDIAIEGRTIEEILIEFAERFITFIMTPCAQGTFRTAVSESERFPQIGQAFYASGLEHKHAWLAPVIAAAAARGELALDDPDLAAHRFIALCQAEVFMKRLFGIVESYSEAEIGARAADTVKAFIRMHRPD